MPTYGYRCTACDHKFERIQKMTDPALTACESCGGAVKKMLYPVGIAFKGSGFYVNDYSKSSGGGTAKSESSADPKPAAETKSESTTSASTDSKPAAPASPAPAATSAS